MENKVIVITGASSGIGKSSAAYLASKGYTVYGTSRHASLPPKSNDSDSFFMIKMDIDDDVSVNKAIQYIIKKEGRIDVLVNNAGWGISGAIEETSLDLAKSLFETNFFGQLRSCNAVLPSMREQRHGLIINISSIGGILGLPFQGLYSATKFAVEGLTEALRMEVKEYGLNIVLVEPGDFKTSFTRRRKKISTINKKSVYQNKAMKTMAVVEHDEQQGSSPVKIAYLLEKIICSSHPKIRYQVGSFSQKFIAKMKGVFPGKFTQWILMKYYKIL